jgi:hypothetical protein
VIQYQWHSLRLRNDASVTRFLKNITFSIEIVRWSGRDGIDVDMQQSDVHDMDKSPTCIHQPPNEKITPYRISPVFSRLWQHYTTCMICMIQQTTPAIQSVSPSTPDQTYLSLIGYPFLGSSFSFGEYFVRLMLRTQVAG